MSAIVEKFLAENPLVEHASIQGTPEWESERENLDGSSEAAAMLGLSKKTTRSQLMHMKHTGDKKEFSKWVQESILDQGHRVEAMARPIIESIIGGKLYPVMQSRGRISASCDGLKAAGDVAWENKQWNEEYAAMVAEKILPEEHAPQCYQILLVTGASKLIFTITDGTAEKMVRMEVLPDRAWFERIILGWVQFNKERAEYVPPVEVAKPVAAVVTALPVVTWNLQGTQITSNLEKEVKPAVLALIDKYNFTPETDQDFADLKAFGENARDAVLKSKAVRETVLANLADINAFNVGMLEIEELLTKAAITAENVYKAENINRKNQLRAKGQARFDQHINELQASINGVKVAFAAPDLAAATKNLRTLASFGNAVETCVSNAIVAADKLAADVRAKLTWCKENAAGHSALFHDLQSLMLKPMEDFTLTIASRIKTFHEQEQAKLEAVRVQAEADARSKIEAEAKAKEEEEARAAAKELATKPVYGSEQAQNEALGMPNMATGTGRLGAASSSLPAADIFAPENPQSASVTGLTKKPTRPSDSELIEFVAQNFNVTYGTACDWILEIAERMKVAA